MSEKWAYFDAHVNKWLGPAGAAAPELLRSADLLLNISGINPIRDWFLNAPHRVLIDTDPVFTQIRHLKDGKKMQDARAHTAFFTFGENFGKPDCSIPDDGLSWLSTRQPVVLDAWPVCPGKPDANFTTVMQWDSYPAQEHGGRSFGMKSASFVPYLDLPRRTGETLELAIGSASAPRDQLCSHGWIVTDPLAVTRTAATYQQFIRDSKAEFTVAKHGYVATRSGWFSERSAVYLASARPVVTQDTAFTDLLPADGGVLAFDSPDSAAAAVERVDRDYARQCRRARAVAEEFFESGVVLNHLLRRATQSAFAAK